MIVEKRVEKMNFREKLCGMNSHYRYYSLERFFQEMHRLHISYCEIWTGPMHFYVDYQKNQDVETLKELSQKYGVQIIGICPEQTNPKPNNIATPTRKEDVFAYYCRMVDIAKAVGAKQILVTSGWAYYDEKLEDAYERSVQMVRNICEYADSKNIMVVMEALQIDESILVNSVEDMKKYVDRVDHPNLKVCIDFGAMARVNDSIQDYFDAFGEKVVHTHFVDGKPTGHLAWGDGERNLNEDLECLKLNHYQGYLSLETATSRYYEKPWSAEEKTLMGFAKRKEEKK